MSTSLSKTLILAATSAAAVALMSLANAPNAEARHRHRSHWGGVSIMIGAPMIYSGYGYRPYAYAPPYAYRRAYYRDYYRGYEPYCREWGWVYSRRGRAKWRCIYW